MSCAMCGKVRIAWRICEHVGGDARDRMQFLGSVFEPVVEPILADKTAKGIDAGRCGAWYFDDGLIR